MEAVVPKLCVCYIDLKANEKDNIKLKEQEAGVADAMKNAALAFRRTLQHRPSCYVIRSKWELAGYTNARGNNWVMSDRPGGKSQYYIVHPKKSSSKVLIEAEAFHKYIDDEEKAELLDFIFSHCPVKNIQITRKEVSAITGNAKLKAVNVNADFLKKEEMYFNWSSKNGAVNRRTRREYVWLEKSLMSSIAALKKGGSLDISYNSDRTFGLKASEARMIGIDTKCHKEYTYRIVIEC